MNDLLPVLLLVPALACVLIAAGFPAKPTALGAALFNLFLSLVLACGFPVEASGYAFVFKRNWVDLSHFFKIDFHLGLDGLSLPLVLLTTVVSVAAVAVAPATIKRSREFFICVLLIGAGALGAFLAVDVFFLYAFHELALIPTFLLIGFWGSHDRKFSAWQITLYLGGGSLVLLAGLLAFYFALPDFWRTLDLRVLQATVDGHSLVPAQQNIIFPLLLVGFGILVSLWPFHSWAPQGYASAPASAAMLHAGVLKKFGLYGLLRLALPFVPEGLQHWMPWLLALLLFNILYVGLTTIAQRDLDMMLGYSSVMHMGYLFLGLASFNLIGLSGVVVLMVAHGLSAALLFGLASEVKERTGTVALKEMGGLAKRAPLLAFLFVAGGLASIGLPGLGNFAGEVMIFFGAWKPHPWATVAAVWGVVISAVYMLRAVRDIFYGDPMAGSEKIGDLGAGQAWPYVLLLGGLLAVGVLPGWITERAKPVLTLLLGGS